MSEHPELSLAEWTVLALVAEAPAHGFALASLTAADGPIGRAWQVPRPIVYRALSRLTELALVAVSATEPGTKGPQRSVLAATEAGRRATQRWLSTPVAHVRDVRSELLVKLALLDRRGRTSARLIAAQRATFVPIEQALRQRQQVETGFDRVLATWRTENVRAALNFLDELEGLASPNANGASAGQPAVSAQTPPAEQAV